MRKTVLSGLATFALLLGLSSPFLSDLGAQVTSGGSGGCSGASATTQVLFNDAGLCAGDAGLTYNKTTDFLSIAGGVTVSSTTRLMDHELVGDAASSAQFLDIYGGTAADRGARIVLYGPTQANAGDMFFSTTNGAGTGTERWRIKGATGHFAAAGAYKFLAGGVISPLNTVSTITTIGAATYTAAQLVGGVILRDPNGAARSDVTPTAALLLAELPGAQVGQAFEFTIRNTADAAETITVTAGTGATLSGTMTIAQNNSKRFMVVFTNVTASTEAYTLYSLGTVIH